MWLNAFTAALLLATVNTQQVSLEADDDVSCEPEIADTCFTSVEDDLRKIFTINTTYDNTYEKLYDLCSAWNESLACTSDIIDTGCLEEDGKLKFDHWHSALEKTWQFVCIENMQVLRDIFQSARCFNVTSFFYCVETTAGLSSMKELLLVDLDVTECKYLHKVIEKCGEYETLGSCALETLEPLNAVFNVFFKSADCSRKQIAQSTANTMADNQLLVYVILIITTSAIFN